MQEKRNRCPSCRNPWDEATSDEMSGEWEVHVHRCNPCEMRDAAEKNAAEGSADQRLPAGLMFSVGRKRRANN